MIAKSGPLKWRCTEIHGVREGEETRDVGLRVYGDADEGLLVERSVIVPAALQTIAEIEQAAFRQLVEDYSRITARLHATLTTSGGPAESPARPASP